MTALGLALGLPFQAPLGGEFIGSLDDFTANLTGAWSVARRLLSGYTGPLIRVRRSSDNTESDIGYTPNGSLDAAAMAAFVGSGNGMIRYVYDQFSSNDFEQSTAAAQPTIVVSGSILTSGGRPSWSTDGVDDYLQCTTLTQTQPFSVHSIWADQEVTGYTAFIGRTSISFGIGIDPSTNLYLYGSTGFERSVSPRTANAACDQFIVNGASSSIRRNGLQLGATGTTNGIFGDTMYLASNGNSPALYSQIYFSELAVFNSASVDVTSLYADAASFYTL